MIKSREAKHAALAAWLDEHDVPFVVLWQVWRADGKSAAMLRWWAWTAYLYGALAFEQYRRDPPAIRRRGAGKMMQMLQMKMGVGIRP